MKALAAFHATRANALLAALQRYGKHDSDCPQERHDGNECTCGLAEGLHPPIRVMLSYSAMFNSYLVSALDPEKGWTALASRR
jgi:hypothetical protein